MLKTHLRIQDQYCCFDVNMLIAYALMYANYHQSAGRTPGPSQEAGGRFPLHVTALIEDALREAVAKPRRKRPKKRVGLRTYGKQGLLPGVEIDDTASLLELMETPVGPARR
jgi:hypothetical protein